MSALDPSLYVLTGKHQCDKLSSSAAVHNRIPAHLHQLEHPQVTRRLLSQSWKQSHRAHKTSAPFSNHVPLVQACRSRWQLTASALLPQPSRRASSHADSLVSYMLSIARFDLGNFSLLVVQAVDKVPSPPNSIRYHVQVFRIDVCPLHCQQVILASMQGSKHSRFIMAESISLTVLRTSSLCLVTKQSGTIKVLPIRSPQQNIKR
eukprot:140717-Hanusia_phi.AAC.2